MKPTVDKINRENDICEVLGEAVAKGVKGFLISAIVFWIIFVILSIGNVQNG